MKDMTNFIDLAFQQNRIKDKLTIRIQNVLDHGQYMMGPEVQELENRLSQYVGVKYAVGCSSGTDALLMSLMANNVGPGDVIFTTPFTFIATAEVISLLGAVPAFVDIDPRSFNIDSAKLERAIQAINAGDSSLYPIPSPTSPTSRSPYPIDSKLISKGLIAVDLFGLPCNYDDICTIAQEHNLFMIEDAAQSFGAEYKGRKACSFGKIAATSFFPAKPLGCYGDGGMCFTDDAHLADALRSIRLHGKGSHKYDNARIGINGRLDTIQAAILNAKFDIFPEEVELRQKVAETYTNLFSPHSAILCPYTSEGYKCVWAQYSVLAQSETTRTELQSKLNEASIPTAVYYPKPLHLQTAFKHLGYKSGDFPVSEDCSKRIFSLPMHPYLKSEEQEQISEIILEV